MAEIATDTKSAALEKSESPQQSGRDVEILDGHMKEIEVKLDDAIHETEVYDEDSEHSPYPEGMFRSSRTEAGL